MRRWPHPDDLDGWVSQLRFPSRIQRAKQHLLGSGPRAVPALRRGLRHGDADVRRRCVGLLDQLLDEATLPDLVVALDDDDHGVRARALHALACDRCKQNGCLPGEDVWVPRAVDLLDSRDPDLRAAAIEALGRVARRRPDVAGALVAAAERETDKGLRSMARWHAGAAG